MSFHSTAHYLIPLTEHNLLVALQRRWSPFSRGANGFACPSCGEELIDKSGTLVERRSDWTRFRRVLCEKKGCGFTGKREIL